MNEDNVKQQLQDKIAASGVVLENESIIDKPEIEHVEVEAMHNNLPLDNMVLEQNVMNLLDVPNAQRNSVELKDQINTIIKWASENSGDKEMSSMLETIHRQLRMMGAALKEDRVDRLYKYVRINNIIKGYEVQARALYE